MRGKVHLLMTVCTQLAHEVCQQDMALTNDEAAAVFSCVQEIEEHVLPHRQQEDQAA
jgi:hypothetical protein